MEIACCMWNSPTTHEGNEDEDNVAGESEYDEEDDDDVDDNKEDNEDDNDNGLTKLLQNWFKYMGTDHSNRTTALDQRRICPCQRRQEQVTDGYAV